MSRKFILGSINMCWNSLWIASAWLVFIVQLIYLEWNIALYWDSIQYMWMFHGFQFPFNKVSISSHLMLFNLVCSFKGWLNEKIYWNTIQYLTVIERKCEFQCIFWFPIERYRWWRMNRKWEVPFDFQWKIWIMKNE